MTHQQIHDNEIIEQYVLQKLSPADRQAFQEHYFECDECFAQANSAARFIAGVREASKSGVLAAAGPGPAALPNRWTPAVFNPGWARVWAMPALAMCLMLAVALIGLWALSLRRQNQLLVQQTAEQRATSERLQSLEAKIRELKASDSASQGQKESLNAEVARLKEQLAATEERESQVAQLRPPPNNLQQPEVNVPVRNIYPLGDAQRSGGSDEVNHLNVERGARTFDLILGDYQPGYSSYRLEIRDSSGRLVTTRAGLKPDKNGELSVRLNRTIIAKGQYRMKLYGQGKSVAEYIIELSQ